MCPSVRQQTSGPQDSWLRGCCPQFQEQSEHFIYLCYFIPDHCTYGLGFHLKHLFSVVRLACLCILACNCETSLQHLYCRKFPQPYICIYTCSSATREKHRLEQPKSTNLFRGGKKTSEEGDIESVLYLEAVSLNVSFTVRFLGVGTQGSF